ncbi:MAG: sugar kinase [Armatimonadetes bacterium]|nr:sugar kinase [Armatimonadota bacterium]
MGSEACVVAPDVLALGSVMVEISPTELGVPLTEVRELRALPGGASCNFAAALAKLGVRVALATGVGDDEWGQWVTARMAELGIDTSRVKTVAGQLTTVSFCWADRLGGKRFYFYRVPGHSDPIAALSAEDVVGGSLAGVRFFDLSEAAIRKPPLREVAFEAAERAKSAGVSICYAVNYRPASWSEGEDEIRALQRKALSLADVAVMNREEAAFIADCDELGAALDEIERLGPAVVAVTGGEEGTIVCADGKREHVPARKVEVLYDVGAGDVFHAGLLAGLILGKSPAEAARFGSDAAALWISRPNDLTELPTREEAEGIAGWADCHRSLPAQRPRCARESGGTALGQSPKSGRATPRPPIQ